MKLLRQFWLDVGDIHQIGACWLLRGMHHEHAGAFRATPRG
jgi:hypothetical protein